MINRFRVKAFKSLDDVEVELGQVNVFIGANGSGKTNLLEALGVLGAAAFGRVDDESLLRRGVRPGVPKLYKSSFRGLKARDAVRFEAHTSEASYQVELRNPLLDPSPAWEYKTELLEEPGRKVVGRSPRRKDYRRLNPVAGEAALRLLDVDAQAPAASLLNALREYSIYAPNTGALRGLIPDPQQREPVGLAGGRLPEAVNELWHLRWSEARFHDIFRELTEMIGWVDDFGMRSLDDVPLSASVASPRRVLYFRDRYMADGRNVLTGYDASEGVLYVLLAAILATHPRSPRVLAIDNVDHALNPRLARALMERLCAWVLDGPTDKQLLLTSHNPLVLDGLPLGNDRVRLFAVDRSRKGRTSIRRVDVDDELMARVHDGWTLSRLWVMGHLGGVPDV